MSNEIHSESTEERNNDSFNEDGEGADIETDKAEVNDNNAKDDTVESEDEANDNTETEANDDDETETNETKNDTVESESEEAEAVESDDEDDEEDEADDDADDEADAEEGGEDKTEHEKLVLTIKPRLNDEDLSNSLDKAVSEFNNNGKTIINLFLFEFLFRNFELDSENTKHITFLRTNNIITEKSGGTRKNRNYLRKTRRHI
jgi:hypothetical protein